MASAPLSSDQVPFAALLGGTTLRTLVMDDGSGGTWYGAKALTRWRADAIERNHGWFFHVCELDGSDPWRIGTDPLEHGPGATSTWQAGRFAIERTVRGIEARLEICVAPDAPVEIRRVTLHNASDEARRLTLTSALEVVLANPMADASHPAFSNLFVQTEHVESSGVLLARRRPRDQGDAHPVMFACLNGPGELTWDTDRAAFLGRAPGGPIPPPFAGGPLGGSAGNVLDPAFVLRRTFEISAGESLSFNCVLGIGSDRESALSNAAAFSNAVTVERAFGNAARIERERLAHLHLDDRQAAQLQALACAALNGDPRLRAPRETLERAHGNPDALATWGLQPQHPFMLLDGTDGDHRSFEDAMRAQSYYVELGLPLQLLIAPGRHDADNAVELPSGVVSVQPHVFSEQMLDLAKAATRWVIDGPMTGWPHPAHAPVSEPDDRPVATAQPAQLVSAAEAHRAPVLQYDNGHGGFSPDGREYVIRVDGSNALATRPPAPWVNVIANPRIGFVVSESGAATTWGANSRNHRLTPWFNDPARDPHGEALFLRDEETGEFWSPQPGPVPGGGHYEVRHGLGQSCFVHTGNGIRTETLVFVDRDDPVRFTSMRIRNHGTRPRRIAVVSYQQLVLGDRPEESARFVVTSRDAESGALTATRHVGRHSTGLVAFAHAVSESSGISCTTDRERFLGSPGSIARPAALDGGSELDGRVGSGLAPCFALRVVLEIEAGSTSECTFLLGEGAGSDETARLLSTYGSSGAIDAARARATGFWDALVSGLQIETPEPALDLIVNAWLPYQTLSCRLIGRSAFYQSGGAFGFRDQLQDATALMLLDPTYTSRQILLHAAHQFVEGDVLHWWHPPADGIRTRFADDLLWLPHVTSEYVRWTGDHGLLDRREPFLEGPALAEGEAERFMTARESDADGTLYEHCCRAIDRSLATGAHGLPLFGAGDWNDGMNRVGQGGAGESVWMGFFLSAVLRDFIPLCESRKDDDRVARYRRHRAKLRDALDSAGWDGEWYRRAYYDDGTPLGTAGDEECRIDGLSQAWAVLSGVAGPERAEQAMDAVERLLVSEKDGLIRLLTPAFENTPRDPGYIKGYVRGVRENGGQYTHAALWMVRALAQLGRRERAAHLLVMLSPVSHTATPERVATYRAEPYSIAADVYGEPPHVGRGGWSWYTGSSGWMYRVAVESILGLTVEGNHTLRIRPCLPQDWPTCKIEWRVPGEQTSYAIELRNGAGRDEPVGRASLDGTPLDVRDGTAIVPIVRDGSRHHVVVVVGAVGEDARRHQAPSAPAPASTPGR